MMLGGKCLAMTGNTFGSVESDSLLRRDRLVRIVAAYTGHGIARLLFAEALCERFELAGGSQAGRHVSSENEVTNVLGQVVARREFVDVLTGALDRRIAF